MLTNLFRTFLTMFLPLLSLTIVTAYDTEDVVNLRATIGRDAHLPCGQEKVFLDGPDAYVTWVKDDNHFIYRFPNDDEGEDKADGMDVYYGEGEYCDRQRKSCVNPTSLILKTVSETDAGVYSCRINYQSSPSVDYVINVQVVPSPGVPKIFEDEIKEVTTGYIGPLSLGSDLKFNCKVEDADNDTIVYWIRNGVIVTGSRHVSRWPLTIEYSAWNITRDELNAHYECVAQNSDISEPLVAMVSVKMYLPPTSVEIRLNNNFNFASGQPRVVDCVVIGCVPPPTITWRLGNVMLKENTHKEHHDGNFTVSSLSVTPSLQDHQASLTCRAHNPYLQDQVYEESVSMNVGYKPVGLTTREEIVGVVDKAAETVSCSVEAVPEPLQFIWTFGSSRTVFTSAQRIPGHRHRYSSTLTFLPTDEDLGPLEARATNSFGAQSKPCLYQLSRGGPPEPPSCVLLRAYPRAARIECKKGFDGGRPQMINMELLTESGNLVLNRSNSLGHFHLQDLEDEGNMTVLVYATSERGRSPNISLSLYTLPPTSTGVTGNSTDDSNNKWLVVSAQAVVTIVIVVAVAIAFSRRRRANRKHEHGHEEIRAEHNPDIVPRTDGTFHREPDFTRDERSLASTTTITVNQSASRLNDRDVAPLPYFAKCYAFVDTGTAQSAPKVQPNPPKPQHSNIYTSMETCLTSAKPTQHTFYV